MEPVAQPPVGPLDLAAEDRELLTLAEGHRYLLPEHAGALGRGGTDGLGVGGADGLGERDAAGRERGGAARLERLAEAGLLRAVPQPGGGRWFQITRRGLTALGSALSPPRLSAGTAEHDRLLVWVELAARAGSFGPLAATVSERRMRSHDLRPAPDGEPLGLRSGGVDRHGRPALHHPDLLLIDRSGRRIAVELELTGKTRARRQAIFTALSTAPELTAVLYLVRTPQMAAVIRRYAREYGIADRVHVQPAPRPGGGRRRDGGPARSAVRTRPADRAPRGRAAAGR